MNIVFYHSVNSILTQIPETGMIFLVNVDHPEFYVSDSQGCQLIGTENYITPGKLYIGNKGYTKPQMIEYQLTKLIKSGYVGVSGGEFFDICPVNTMEVIDKIDYLREATREQKPGILTKLKKIF